MYITKSAAPSHFDLWESRTGRGEFAFLPLGEEFVAAGDGEVHVGARTGKVPVKAGDRILMKSRGCPAGEGTLFINGVRVS